jgi:hypothetical protein
MMMMMIIIIIIIIIIIKIHLEIKLTHVLTKYPRAQYRNSTYI